LLVESYYHLSTWIFLVNLARNPMQTTPTVVALCPMKDVSVRVVGKNYRTFHGQPLCYWVLNALRACTGITKICVNTDSKHIKELLAQDFPDMEGCAPVVVIDRPAHLLNDPPMNEIVRSLPGHPSLCCPLCF
jgi:CMP-N-acetylneuraminic acid synthetase